jgi:hypothetical protein
MRKAEFVEWLEEQIKSLEASVCGQRLLGALSAYRAALEKAKQLEEPK